MWLGKVSNSLTPQFLRGYSYLTASRLEEFIKYKMFQSLIRIKLPEYALHRGNLSSHAYVLSPFYSGEHAISAHLPNLS